MSPGSHLPRPPVSRAQPPRDSAAPSPSLRFQPRCVLWHSGLAELPGELLNSLTKKIGRLVVCTDAYAALAEACLTDREYRDLTGATPDAHKHARAGVLLIVLPTDAAIAPQILDAAEQYAPNLQRWIYDRSANPKLRPVVPADMTIASPPRTFFAPPTQPPRAEPPQRVEPKPVADEPPRAHTAALAAQGGLHLARDASPAPAPVIAISGPGLGFALNTAGAHGPFVPSSPTPTHAPASSSPPRLRIAGAADSAPPTPTPSPAARPAPLLTPDELHMLLSDDPIPPKPGAYPSHNGSGNSDGSSGRGGAR